ncbi:fungal-specific transcription factor domain-containing protein [Amylocarpus encephaloides]|uniref:Fungal-specific transcription factor domain-containing protein n=1 Tax=Amylocarpus encephaloides TaxID=45428 RepID=A0A9P8C2W7_9HELO|nr:fungal-specific transcription factor domain-containing protein [Amylocarpus encephaloides]
MTLPLACPPASTCAASDPPTVPQRKRRRRAPASGASDDCFACTKRNTKCDRRRPYCSQCLEVGKECSGYKTQLTWGVGVASRGKLRGLSLPVARSAPVMKSPPPTRPRTDSITVSPARDGSEMDGVKIKMENAAAAMPVNPYTTYDFVNMAPNGVTPPMQMSEWNMAAPQDYPLHDYQQDSLCHQRQLPHLHRLHTHTLSLGRGDGLHMSSSLESLSAYAESEYSASPITQSFPGDDAPFLRSPMPIYTGYSSRNTTADASPVGGMMGDSRGPTSCPDHFYAQSEISSSISSHQNLYDIAEGGRQAQPGSATNENFYDDEMLGSQHIANDIEVYATSARSSHFGWNSINDDDVASQATSEADPYQFSGPDSMSSSTESSPRVSFFLNYYEKIICPSVVVIDSPNNPYREHILSLASSSRSLQHAICALSACNLRMKRRQSLGQDHWRRPLELELQDQINSNGARPAHNRRTSNQQTSPASDPRSTDQPLEEEYQHRSLAVSLLNQQLSDPSTARHDCVLATLFILCHYRMCESGIAQFRTQFAGVKKILGMRESGVETGNWGWMETLFTYFDGIAASINDREAQLRGGYLDMIANPSDPSHALENVAGCDSVLFKTIARLGRLNMLSQHRPVLDDSIGRSPTGQARRPSPPNPRPRLAGQALVDFYNLHAHNFDGNGFASTLDDDSSFSLLTNNTTHDDLRTNFWTEWKAARKSLQEWEFDPSRLVSTLPTTPSPTQLRDFGYISEAFRYAALLYTERLACPNLPSAHLNFQNLVSQVLYYVTSLEQGSGCEKFLLWPLFICGSECVNDLQQSIVRAKCREIMGRSGYLNNLAGLEVLEKLWEDRDNGGNQMREHKEEFGGPFKWSRFMEGGEGEWIMF